MKAKATRADLGAEYLALNPAGDTKGLNKCALRFLIFVEKMHKSADPKSKYRVLYRL